MLHGAVIYKHDKGIAGYRTYLGTFEFGTPKGLWKTVLNSEVVLFLRSISMYWIGLGTEVGVLISHWGCPYFSDGLKGRFHCTCPQCSTGGLFRQWSNHSRKMLDRVKYSDILRTGIIIIYLRLFLKTNKNIQNVMLITRLHRPVPRMSKNFNNHPDSHCLFKYSIPLVDLKLVYETGLSQ